MAAAGVVAALLVGLGARLVERTRFGASDAETLARVRVELGDRFDRTAEALAARASRVVAASDLIRRASTDSAEARRLFTLLESELPEDVAATAGITVLDGGGRPLAWVGRVSDLPRERTDGPDAVFVALDALGPRLVRVQPIVDPERASSARLATIVVEERVGPDRGVTPTVTDRFLLPTSLVDVALQVGPVPPTLPSPYAFAIELREGQVIAQAEVTPQDLQAARESVRAWSRAAVLGVLALTVLVCALLLLDWRRASRRFETSVAATLALIALLLAARGLIWLAMRPFVGPALDEPQALLPNALLLGSVTWLTLDLMERRRLASPRSRLRRPDTTTSIIVAVGYLTAAFAGAMVVWAYERVLQTVAAQSSLDLLHFSLHPIEPVRLLLAGGLVLLHGAVVWAAAVLLRAPAIAWRTPRILKLQVLAILAATGGVAIAVAVARPMLGPIPMTPFLVAMAAAGAGSIALDRPQGRFRRGSQAARLGLLFVALLLPSMALYPSILASATQSKERLVSDAYSPQVIRQRDDLKLQRLPHALEAIDANPALTGFVTSASDDAAPTTDRAFIIWSQTELANYRTTSAVELYGANGRLISRFNLILPEYGTTTDRPASCDEWDLYEEASPFGSTLRPVLRATRAICEDGVRVGAIVVRAMLDYRSLPFSSPESPYVDALRGGLGSRAEGSFGRDIRFAVYGWSRAPIYAPDTSVWPLPDEVFDRMVAAREPLWTTVRLDGDPYKVYYFNDSFGIYALGYPVITWTGHLINLGELAFLTGTLFLVLVVGSSAVNLLARRTHESGRTLLREVRSSFYRKLFLAFVASSVVPVVVLAVATRTYLVNQLRATVEDSAVKTATIAQRLVEDYAQQRGADASPRVDDQFMVLMRWAIDQDVNLFEGPQLQATSERDLFASHLLPSRTPSQVYRSIVLDRLPTSVGVENMGGLPYLLAAAPVRTGGREGIVTVPQPLRGEEIERQRDELDRRVLSASVLFVLLGAGLGYWMAERIADPVNRLTRATRRIARGDLDARIAITSSDELRRLVEDFNQMADDLKRQRANLERTQRLEAWADMARQVAHDIKNPLTPIQLSAEHARRVNLDRGRPLSPALDECVTAILSQVRLLRQIAAEFSSFASSPTANPEPVAVGDLIEEVVASYRIGLSGRIEIDVRVEPDLPRALADRTLVARALTNIIENALHAMPGGGRLTIGSRRAPGADGRPAVVVEVSDTGVGMDQDALARLFEPYFSTKATGTGLGLTIAKRNIELSGGTIAVSSARGVGTTVTLTLQVA